MSEKIYEVLREIDTLELVCCIKANSLEEAKEKALQMGYGKGYRVEESYEE